MADLVSIDKGPVMDWTYDSVQLMMELSITTLSTGVETMEWI